jgi:hypothetical protein
VIGDDVTNLAHAPADRTAVMMTSAPLSSVG